MLRLPSSRWVGRLAGRQARAGFLLLFGLLRIERQAGRQAGKLASWQAFCLCLCLDGYR